MMKKTTQMNEKRCYSVSDLQEMLGISKPAVYEYKISKRSFDEWLDGSFDTDQAPLEDVESI